MERSKINPAQVAAIAGVVVGLIATFSSVRLGILVMAVVMVTLAAARVAGRPEHVVTARSRSFDVAILLQLGVALTYI